MSEAAASGLLSGRELGRIFEQKIRPFYDIAGLSPVERPRAIILGGQPGSGKSAALESAAQELAKLGDTLTINGDELRRFHPLYDAFQEGDPLTAADRTGPAIGRWVEMLIDVGKAARVNLAIESTMRQPDVFERTARSLRSAGYRLEALGLAVHRAFSWLGVHQRFEAQLEDGPSARFTLREAHDAAAAGVVETLRKIEGKLLVDALTVLRRGGEAVFVNRTVGATWEHTPAAADWTLEEQTRQLSSDEMASLEIGWSRVLAQMAARRASSADMERVRREMSEAGVDVPS